MFQHPSRRSFASILSVAALAALAGCSNKKDVDAGVREYMNSPDGQALVQKAVRQVLTDAAHGKAVATPETREHAKTEIPSDGSPMLGDSAAKHSLVVFVDYVDPFALELMTAATQAMRDDKKALNVIVKYAPRPRSGLALPAAKAVAAAQAMGHFQDYQGLVLAQQRTLTKDKLVALAEQLGMKPAEFLAKMSEPSIAASIERDEETLAKVAPGMGGGPVAYLDGVRLERSEFNAPAIKAWLAR